MHLRTLPLLDRMCSSNGSQGTSESVILMPRNPVPSTPVMAGLMCSSSNNKEESSGSESPPPILDRYTDDEVTVEVTSESVEVEEEVDTIAVLPNESENVSSESKQTGSAIGQEVETVKIASLTKPKTNFISCEIRRSSRKTVPTVRSDALVPDRGCSFASTSGEETKHQRKGITKKETSSDTAVACVRVGDQYQADVPLTENWVEPTEDWREKESDRDTCVWRNDHNRIDAKELEEFYQVTRQQFGFNPAKALEAIYRCGYDMVRAMEAVEEVDPELEVPYNEEELRAFQKCLSAHGKNFSRMQKVIPTRSVSSLVNHYYMTKRAKCFGVISNEPCPLLTKLCDDEQPLTGRWDCDNCALANGRGPKRRKGRYCGICDLYFRRVKRLRPFTVPLKSPDDERASKPHIYGLTTGIENSSSVQVPNGNREKESSHQCSYFAPRLEKLRWESFWTEEEKMEAVKGFHRFGKNFEQIASYIGTKSPSMIRHFYEDHQSIYRLDFLVGRFNKAIKAEERVPSEGETSGRWSAGKDNDDGGESGSARRSQREHRIASEVAMRVAARHKIGNGQVIKEEDSRA